MQYVKSLVGLFAIVMTISLMAFSLARSQVWEEWVARYNAPYGGADLSKAIALSSEGPAFVTGYTNVSWINQDITTIMYSSSGQQMWVANYNGPANSYDQANDIIVDEVLHQGLDEYIYIYVTGYSTGSERDFITLKYNTSGQELWAQRYDGPAHDEDIANALAADMQGNIYVTGYSSGVGTGWDITTIKYSQAGSLLWVQRYNGTGNGNDAANDIAIDDQGNIYVAGFADVSISSWNLDLTVIKYNSAGVQQWAALYHHALDGLESANAIALDVDGNILATGYRNDYPWFDYLTVKFNSAGRLEWDELFLSDDTMGIGYDVATDPGGNVYTVGALMNFSTSRAATLKYSPLGTLLWSAIVASQVNNLAGHYAIQLDGQADAYVCGRTNNYGSGDDYVTRKYSASGVELWSICYSGPDAGTDCAADLAIDPYQAIYVTGRSSSGGGSLYDYATIKYSQTGPPTPVVLSSFTAAATSDGVQLRWQTASEINCYGWFIERRQGEDGYGDVSPLIPGHGTTEDPHEYGFTDESAAPGYAYTYRLEQIDLGGSVTYSNPVTIAVPFYPLSFSLYPCAPNPFNASTVIRYELPEAMEVTLEVFNVVGAKRASPLQHARQEAGVHEVAIEGSNLPSGIYIYRLSAGDFSASEKMLLMK